MLLTAAALLLASTSAPAQAAGEQSERDKVEAAIPAKAFAAPSKPRKLLIFDLDGTLVDSMEDIVGSVNRALRRVRLQPLKPARIAGFVGSGVRKLVELALREALGRAPDPDALDAAPDDSALLRTVGILANRRGDHLRAVSTLQSLVLRQPGDAEALFYLGKSLLAQGNRTEAAESLRQAAHAAGQDLVGEVGR